MNQFIYWEEYNNNTPTDHSKYLHINNYKPNTTAIYNNFSDGAEQYFPEEDHCETTITEKIENSIITSNTWLYQVFEDEGNCANTK